MNVKRLISLFILVIIISLFYGYNVQLTNDASFAKVKSLPAGYDSRKVYEPYKGLHPSRLQRPRDDFKFPIQAGDTGPVKALFAGPLEYPFVCQTEESGLGQPLVDNQDGEGTTVFKLDENGNRTREIIGYSRDCSLPTRAFYMYRSSRDQQFHHLGEGADDIEKITVNGHETDFIVRVEIGTINRYLYMLYALKGRNETLEKPQTDNWNRRLIYQFRGGVGIGKRQGKLSIVNLLERNQDQLAAGYAAIHSTGNQTSVHYNIWMSEDTALRVKKQFTSQYGEPDYTVGLGGSGGAIQQYLLAQNNRHIIDAALAIYSYPDMLSQTTYVLDCELMEYFFDVTDVHDQKWSSWKNRSLVEGMNAVDDAFNKYQLSMAVASLLSLKMPQLSMGMSECVQSWRGLTPLILNPHFPDVSDRLSSDVQQKTTLTYWDNLKWIYGTDREGEALNTWDNVGVQYGLMSLKKGLIDKQTFLRLNASIGSWKPSREMQKEDFWMFTGNFWPERFSVWSHQNMQLSNDPLNSPAPRQHADPDAIEAAWRSGQIFTGQLDIPVIDLRHYLDPELDMHHSFTSFMARSRMLKTQGHADNQVIWMTSKPHTPIMLALEHLDRWLMNIKRNPEGSVADNRPEDTIDRCFDGQGKLIAEGKDAWNGDWNGKDTGACMKRYPSYQSSRMVAGDSISGDVFKCQLQPVRVAIKKGLYAPVDMSAETELLEKIFPEGVCDYSKGDAIRPMDL